MAQALLVAEVLRVSEVREEAEVLEYVVGAVREKGLQGAYEDGGVDGRQKGLIERKRSVFMRDCSMGLIGIVHGFAR